MSDVSTPRSEVTQMQSKAAVCEALDGGTDAMRAAGRAYLPQWPMEDDKGWEARRDSSTLFPGFGKALDTMVGKPFGEPVVVTTSGTIESHLENIDMAGRDIDTFCRDAFRDALKTGLGWILVDYPRIEQPFASAGEEKAAGVRPFWVHIPVSRMIGWRTANVRGQVKVTQVRFYESVEVEDGAFGVATEQRIRVISPGWVQVWHKPKDEWVLLDEGPTSLQEVALVPLYTGRTGFWTAEPPLKDLAWKNVEHWQSASDQRNILHKARVPLLAADEDLRQDTNTPVTIGAAGLITGFKNLHYVEHTGKAIEAGRQDLMDIEDQMRRIAGELLEGGVEKTATESGIEAGEGASWLKVRVRTFQDALEECLRLHAAWIKDSVQSSVVINTEWDDAGLTAEVMTALTQARQAGLISQEVYTAKLAEGGMLPEGTTAEDELARLEAEGPQPMPSVTPFRKPAPMPPTGTDQQGA